MNDFDRERAAHYIDLEAEKVKSKMYETLMMELNDQLTAAISERGLFVDALNTARKELEHDVPYSCYATGPLTGDPIQDLVVCPGCAALKKIDAALTKAV